MDEQDRRDPGAEMGAALRAFADAFGRVAQAWFEQNRPLFEALGKLAEDPRVMACLEARGRGDVAWQPHRPCYCLCGRAHPAAENVCDGEAVTSRRYETARYGLVDVGLCAPCAVAQGLTVASGRG